MIRDAQALLVHLLGRIEVQGPPLFVTASQLADVPKQVIATIADTGLLTQGPPAGAVRCKACTDEHDLTVELSDATDGMRSFGICPYAGRVWLDADDLATWIISIEAILQTLRTDLHLTGPIRERILGRAWSLGRGQVGGTYIEAWMFRGLTWTDAPTVFESIELPVNAWAFGTGTGRLPSGLRARDLGEYLRVSDGALRFQLAQLAAELQGEIAEPAPNVFRREGNMWRVGFNGADAFMLQHLKGLGYLHALLASPNQEFPAFRLLDPAGAVEHDALLRELELEATDQPTLDNLRAVLLRGDLSDGETAGIQSYIKSTTRPGGRPIKRNPAARRAYSSVRHAISRAIETIKPHDSELAAHLSRCVSSRNGFVYRPLSEDVRWKL